MIAIRIPDRISRRPPRRRHLLESAAARPASALYLAEPTKEPNRTRRSAAEMVEEAATEEPTARVVRACYRELATVHLAVRRA